MPKDKEEAKAYAREKLHKSDGLGLASKKESIVVGALAQAASFYGTQAGSPAEKKDSTTCYGLCSI